MKKSQRIYLRDLLERIERIEHVRDAGETVFRGSFLHQDTLIRNFEVLGEIVKQLDESLLAQQPQVNWRGYAGFRDVLIHQYDKVILDIVWESAGDELLMLKAAVEDLLANLEDDENKGST